MPSPQKQPPESKPVVFVIDDDESVCESVKRLLQSVDLNVETFGSADEFLKIELPNGPSCLVLDVRLQGLSGLDFQAEFAKASIQIPIVFITGYGDIPMTVKAMKAGAVGFLPKPFRDQDLLDAVRTGLDRDRVRREHEVVTKQLQENYRSLTAREQQIIALVTSGLLNKQIAAEIGVSEITVKVHRGNVMRKMGAKSLAGLVRMADALGVRPPVKAR
jgi:FixJ family two-component response regulator